MKPFASRPSRDPRSTALNILIALLGVIVLFLGYSLISRHLLSPPVDPKKGGESGGGVIQLDVLNGSGIAGAATASTSYLRSRGFDVVEIRNYKTFDVQESIVVDRRGNLETARKVAYALGINSENIIQQITDDYFVDVSVVIGRDYRSLKSGQPGDTR